MRKFHGLVLSTLALAACQGETPAAQASQAAPTEAAAAPAASTCAPVKLALSTASFSDKGRAAFAEGKVAWTRLSGSFATAYAAACEAGWLAKKPLIDPRAAQKDTLFVFNAPEANQALLRFDESSGAKEMVIEGPFIDPAGNVQVPGAGAIKEAIYCYAVGATAQEQEASGRCLVD